MGITMGNWRQQGLWHGQVTHDVPQPRTPAQGRTGDRATSTAAMAGPIAQLGDEGVGVQGPLGHHGVLGDRVTEVLLPTRHQSSSSNVHDSISCSAVHSRRTSTPVAHIPPNSGGTLRPGQAPTLGLG